MALVGASTVGTAQNPLTIGKTDSRDRNLTNLNLYLYPGETLTFSAAASSSTSDIAASCMWTEEL